MKIYRILSLMALVALMCVPAKAQNDELRHEVAISYGVEPNSVWVDAMTDIIPAMFGQRTDNKKWFGSLGVEYFYHTSPLVGVGGIFTTNVASEDVYSKDELKSYRTKSYFSLMPAVKLNWLRKDLWGLYSKAAAGVYCGRFADKGYDVNGKKVGKSEVETGWGFNWQASLIGIEAGSDNVRGFIELGVGEQGVALAGMRCKF